MSNDLLYQVQTGISVVVQQENITTAFTALADSAPPASPAFVVNLGDVDLTTLNNGAVLVYREDTSKWTSTTTLDAQNMDGGHF